MTDENQFRLTRRRALGGIAAIGVASAAAGVGTSAFFSDQETFEGNSITAGEFGLEVVPEVENIDQDGIGPDEELELTVVEREDKEEAIVAINPIKITDAKPGDSYEFCWDITVEDNPGYVAIAASSDEENGVDAGNVELDDLWDVDDEEDLTTIGEATKVDDVTLDGDSIVGDDDYENLAELLDDLEDGESLGAFDLEEDGEAEKELCIELYIPTDVGNELQGAVLDWDLAFYAEQQRHNDEDDVADNAADALGGSGDEEPAE